MTFALILTIPGLRGFIFPHQAKAEWIIRARIREEDLGHVERARLD